LYHGTVLALFAASHDIFQRCYTEAEVLGPGFRWTGTHQNSVRVFFRDNDIPFVFFLEIQDEINYCIQMSLHLLLAVLIDTDVCVYVLRQISI